MCFRNERAKRVAVLGMWARNAVLFGSLIVFMVSMFPIAGDSSLSSFEIGYIFSFPAWLIILLLFFYPATQGYPWVPATYGFPEDKLIFEVIQAKVGARKINPEKHLVLDFADNLTITGPDISWTVKSSQLIEYRWRRHRGITFSIAGFFLVLRFQSEAGEVDLLLEPAMGISLIGYNDAVKVTKHRFNHFLNQPEV